MMENNIYGIKHDANQMNSEEEYKQKILMERLTKESGCNICPKCGNKDVVNQISFDQKFGSLKYTYKIACSVCKKSYEFTGIIQYNELVEISLTSLSSSEYYSYRILILALSRARLQIEKSLHGMENIPVIATNKNN